MEIDTLPDDVHLYVFDIYLAESSEVEAWHTLIHVCRRWRILVFGSPRRLNLRIACTNETPVREMLDVWPALPIVISNSPTCIDNTKAALEHRDRVCQIDLLGLLTWDLEDIFEALEEPFPALTVLKLHSTDATDPIFPLSDQYLGGTTHLRSLSLTCIPIPELPNLLLSSADLVDLRLMEIPLSIFVPPDEMVAALSALTRLQVFHLEPEFDESHPSWENRRLPQPRRTVLPSLIELRFEGAVDYLDDFMARIDAPLLDHLDIVFYGFDSIILFDTSQVLRFISHVPKFQAFDEAHIGIQPEGFKFWIEFLSTRASSGVLNLEILCVEPEKQFPCLAQFCRSPFFPLPTLESLYMVGGTYLRKLERDGMENARWREFLRPFTSVKNLYLSKNYVRCIATALEELGVKRATEVLPALENVVMENVQLHGSVSQDLRILRQLSGHPIVISGWERTGHEAER